MPSRPGRLAKLPNEGFASTLSNADPALIGDAAIPRNPRPLSSMRSIGGGRRGKGVGVPFHDAPTYAMRELHGSRGNRYGL